MLVLSIFLFLYLIGGVVFTLFLAEIAPGGSENNFNVSFKWLKEVYPYILLWPYYLYLLLKR